MKLIMDANKDAQIKNIKPRFIAVAYIGKDWRRYIDIDELQEIIVSPTIGSNPKAIDAIVEHIGIENVYFLNNLHAKLYIGSNQYAFGSFNLSASAFEEGRGLIEFGCITNEHYDQAVDYFKHCKDLAIQQYSDSESKQKALAELFKKHKKLDLLNKENLLSTTNLENIEKNLTANSDYLIWGVHGEAEYDVDLVKKNNDRYAEIDELDEHLQNYTTFDGSYFGDRIKSNTWVLEVNFDYEEDDKERYSWIFANSIAKNVNEDNASMLIQDDLSEIPTAPPFKLSIINRDKLNRLFAKEVYKPLFYDMDKNESVQEQYDFDVALSLMKKFREEFKN